MCRRGITIKDAIEILKSKGYNLVVATNPIFPIKLYINGLNGQGLNVEDFSYITCYQKTVIVNPI